MTLYDSKIKKSHFVARALRVDSAEEALARLEEYSDFEASHNCWAYKVGDQYRFSDDGEPGGSAGRPILMAIEGQGLDHVLVIVTRYFGGIKLGVGGLVRAYGGAAAECLRQVDHIELHPIIEIEIKLPFQSSSHLHLLLEEIGGTKLEEVFEEDGPRMQIRIEKNQIEQWKQRVQDISRGKGKLKIIEDRIQNSEFRRKTKGNKE